MGLLPVLPPLENDNDVPFSFSVPVTTRTPRPEERNGVDYTFLSKEEFAALEKSGKLLESGIYYGKHSTTASTASV